MGVSRRQTFHGKLSFASAAVKDTRKYQEVWDCLTGDFNTAQMLTSYSLSARPCMFIHLHEDTVTAESEATFCSSQWRGSPGRGPFDARPPTLGSRTTKTPNFIPWREDEVDRKSVV